MIISTALAFRAVELLVQGYGELEVRLTEIRFYRNEWRTACKGELISQRSKPVSTPAFKPKAEKLVLPKNNCAGMLNYVDG